MKQITEDYVSHETAVLLKEKGFNEGCFAYYSEFVDNWITLKLWKNFPRTYDTVRNNGYVLVPTHQMALKWLREVHKIHIVIYPYGEYSCDNYQFDVYKNNKLVISKDDGYITYEQTVEAALLYVLKNLGTFSGTVPEDEKKPLND